MLLYMCAKMYVHGWSWQLLFAAAKTWEQALAGGVHGALSRCERGGQRRI